MNAGPHADQAGVVAETRGNAGPRGGGRKRGKQTAAKCKSSPWCQVISRGARVNRWKSVMMVSREAGNERFAAAAPPPLPSYPHPTPSLHPTRAHARTSRTTHDSNAATYRLNNISAISASSSSSRRGGKPASLWVCAEHGTSVAAGVLCPLLHVLSLSTTRGSNHRHLRMEHGGCHPNRRCCPRNPQHPSHTSSQQP